MSNLNLYGSNNSLNSMNTGKYLCDWMFYFLNEKARITKPLLNFILGLKGKDTDPSWVSGWGPTGEYIFCILVEIWINYDI